MWWCGYGVVGVICLGNYGGVDLVFSDSLLGFNGVYV